MALSGASRRKQIPSSLIIVIGILVSLLPTRASADEKKEEQGYFVLCTKSKVEVFASGQKQDFHNGQSTPCDISEGSIVVVRHQSPFVYNGAALAFVYQDKDRWIPFNRSRMRVINPDIAPQNITAEMITGSSTIPPKGKPGSDFVGKWQRYQLPKIGEQNWLGVPQKGVWFTSAFIVTAEMIQPLEQTTVTKTVPADPAASPDGQLLPQEQLSGIVIIEGDKGVGSGFITEINGNLCVVTNLHVLGGNTKFSIKTLAGDVVRVDVGSLKAAVDADIALLGLAEGQEDIFKLISSENVLNSTKIGNKIVVIGNRLGGGVATQTIGSVRGIGPTQIEVDAKFQSGNSGSPIYDIGSAQVVGVASYTETISADNIAGDKIKGVPVKNETRWFGYRIDSVKEWQQLDWKQWRKQISSMEDYHNASMGGLAIFQGNLSMKHDDVTLQRMVTSFLDHKGRFGKNKQTADLFSKVSGYLSGRKTTMNRMKFYNYFHTCPYWETSLPQQNAFRDKLIEALNDASAAINK
jgi:hypothetical protein